MAIAIGVLKMLLELQQTRKTGALDVAGPGARVRLFVEDGKVVYADEGTLGETLGRILVRERVLTQEQYAAAIEWTTELRASGKPAKLGEVFVALGLLTRDQVHAALSAQMQQKVMRALGWAAATFRFIESPGPLEIADRFETPIEPLVVAALRLADRERIDELLSQSRPRHAALRGDRVPGGGSTKLETIARLNACRLPPADDAFARTLDGSRTVAELLAEEDEEGVDRAVILAALLLTDALDLHRGPTAVRPMSKPKTKSRAKSAAQSALPTPKGSVPEPPEKRQPPASPEPPPKTAAATVDAATVPPISVLTAPSVEPLPTVPAPSVTVTSTAPLPSVLVPANATRTPSSSKPASAPRTASASLAAIAAPARTPAPRVAGSPSGSPPAPSAPAIAPLLAERAYQAGKKLVRAHRLADAVVELTRAASLYPAVEYDLWAAWAAARADARGEDGHAETLRAVANLAIEQDTERGFATFVLAHLARRSGDTASAQVLFAKARAIDPEVATIDAWDRRMRIDAAMPTSTRGEVLSLAPLLTSHALVEGKADAEEDARARARARSESRGEAGEAEAGARAKEAAEARAREREEARLKADGDEKARVEDADAKADGEAKADEQAETNADADANAEADASVDADANVEAEADANADARGDDDADARERADAADRRRIAQAKAWPVQSGEARADGAEARSRGASRRLIVGAVAVAAVAGGLFLVRSREGETEATARNAALGDALPALPVSKAIASADPTADATPSVVAASSALTTSASGPAATAGPRATESPSSSAAPSVEAISTATPSVATASTAAPSVEAASAAAPSPSIDAADASYGARDADLPSVDANRGVLLLPSAADGHRVYVDGRLVGVPPPPIVLACGRHTVKIGSQGRDQIIVVPCGGSIPVAYP